MTDEARPGKHRDTAVVHGAEPRPAWRHSLIPPLVHSTTFLFDRVDDLRAHKTGEAPHPEYGRYENPTVRIVEQKLAALEGAGDAVLFGSGMAALSTLLLTILGRDAHVLITADMYPGSRALFEQLLPRFGIRHTLVPHDDPEALLAACTPQTRLWFCELPSNPHLTLPDLPRMAEAARSKRVLTVVDSTLASPALCRPLEHGADIVLHSATKYLGGHNDLLAGAIAAAAPITEAVRETRGLIGTVLSPQDAFLLNRGLKTLGLRMRRHSANGQAIAERLAADPRVEAVFYPGIGAGADAERTARLLPEGAGGLLSFRPRGGRKAATRFVDELELVSHGGSLGGVESLVQIPSLFSYPELDADGLHERGVEADLIRVALGIEDAEDLWRDIDRALALATG